MKKRPEPKLLSILDPTFINKSAYIDCPDQEIADMCGVDLMILRAKHGASMDRQRALGRRELREAMHEIATSRLASSTSMAIWLSKQHLGFRDKIESVEDSIVSVEVVSYAEVEKSNSGAEGKAPREG